MKDIKNVHYNFIKSIDSRFVEILAEYSYKNTTYRHYIFIVKEDKLTKDGYLRKAKEQFEQDVKNNCMPELHIIRRPLLIALISTLATSTLVLAGLFTWKMLENKGGTPIIPDEEVEINVDPETSKNMTIEPAIVKAGEEYNGVITLNDVYQTIDPSSAVITSNGKELVMGVDYTIDFKSKNRDEKYEYTININADKMSDDISIKIDSGDIEATKITQEQLQSAFAFAGEEFQRAQFVDETVDPYGGSSKAFVTYAGDITYEQYISSYGSIVTEYYHRLPNGAANSENVITYSNYGTSNMYYKDSLYFMRTLAQWPLHQEMNEAINDNLVRVEQISGSPANTFYDSDTLSYVYHDETGDSFLKSFKISFYNGKPVKCDVSTYWNADVYPTEEHTKYVYHADEDPVLPPDTMVYEYSDVTYEITEAQRKELFNKITGADKLALDYIRDSGFRPQRYSFVYDHSKYMVTETDYNGVSIISRKCYNKISVTEYEGYQFNPENSKWVKIPNVTKEEYDTHSLENFRNTFRYIEDNNIEIGTEAGQFIYDPNYSWYLYTNPDESATTGFSSIGFEPEVITSLEGENKEIVCEGVDFYEKSGRFEIRNSYSNFLVNDGIHIEMPKIK